ncbi:Protein of unknown function (DUF1699) (plasmid) [Methanomethylovorans hollandica DSM 15978]|uniref:Uncharacterized protein n=1 Tax=Methanomethylovorans hollandica (strain DSM 15978 / NBRC 107637 / DMS1) TaxID=867904 RepID=L0KZH4_METHD|nr:DUF1699 family protein [Methanomethylovorans hollandica]AGB50812.1 Protein of unknown function (DUF1699) [Methanomethylovorans hollandica DSM 15978]
MELNTNRVRLVTTKEQLKTISPKDKIIHLTFCPNYTTIETILKKSPNIKALIVAESHWNRRSRAVDVIVSIAKLNIIQIPPISTTSSSACHYFEVPEVIIERIQSQENMTSEQVHSILEEETEFPPSLIPFLIEVTN